jgi:hypothetical protein
MLADRFRARDGVYGPVGRVAAVVPVKNRSAHQPAISNYFADTRTMRFSRSTTTSSSVRWS